MSQISNAKRSAAIPRLFGIALAAAAVLFGLQPGSPDSHQSGGWRQVLQLSSFVTAAKAQTGLRRRIIKPSTQKKRLKLRNRTTTTTPTQPQPQTTSTPQKKKRVVVPVKPKVAQPKIKPPAHKSWPPRYVIARSKLLPRHVRVYLWQTPTREFPSAPDLANRVRQGQVILSFAQRTPQAVLDDLAQQYALTYVDGLFVELLDRDIHRFSFGVERSLGDVIAALQADGRAAEVQASYVFSIQSSTKISAADEAQAALQYALAKLRVPAAHKRATGKTVKVAVIDTQVDTAHPELNGATLESFDAISDGVDEADPHGTAITGIIAARKTLRGVAPKAEILAVRAFAAEEAGLGVADTMSLLRGMEWAEDQGARVFNMSFAGPKDPLLLELIDALHARGVIMIAASGNAGPKAAPLYPAAHEHVIAVTATDFADKLYKRANRGEHITLAAPGVDILVVMPDGKFGMMSGTSLATAHISGLVALLLEGNATLSSKEIRDLITQSALDLGPKGTDPQFGAGRADAVDALDQHSKINQVSQH